MDYLRISVHFLLDEFHGRGDSGEKEWPPSPLRLFQAIVNIASRRGDEDGDAALEWLEGMPPPEIIATAPDVIQPLSSFKTYVPDNVGDIVAKSWVKGNDGDISEYRVGKNVHPTRLQENAVVHYLWALSSVVPDGLSSILSCVRCLSALGWGIDLVVADSGLVSEAELAQLGGERWLPSDGGGSTSLRVPSKGTLADLRMRYEGFLSRISLDRSAVFTPVPPLQAYRVVDYRRSTESPPPLLAVFELRKLDDSGFAAFTASRKGLHLGGMLRHCAAQIAPQLGWDEKRVAEFVLGHGEAHGDAHRPVSGSRLVFTPLPSIEFQGGAKGRAVGAIRRVLLTVKGGVSTAEFAAIARALDGRDLRDEKTQAPVAFLRKASTSAGAIKDFFAESCEWVSVTPVVLPGHDDPRKLRRKLNEAMLTPPEKAAVVEKLEGRIDSLFRKALLQAEFPAELVKTAQIQWRGPGFLQGTEMATNYAVPDQHRRFRRLHCRIVFPTLVKGPVCLGGGRHLGLGLFAASPSREG